MEFLILFVLLILSGFFSGSETALTSLSRARAESLAKEGRAGAKALNQLKSNTTRMLVIILIGNNLVNIAASALATVLATAWFGHLGPGIAVGVLTVFILVFGEVTPKSWAARHAESISLFAAPLVLNFGRLLLPAVWLLERFADWLHDISDMKGDPSITESEVISMLEHGALEGTIEDAEMVMIERVFAFNDLTVRDVMTSRHEVYSLDGNRQVREALPDILKGAFSRIPVYQNTPDGVVGVVYLRDILSALVNDKEDARLIDIAKEPLFVPQTQPVDELFAELSRSKRHLAMVVNEYGMMQGVVSLEDMLEELVGEIYDESDRPKEMIREVRPGQIVVEGLAEMRGVSEYFHAHLSNTKPTDTVSLWILNRLGRIPAPSETFQIDGLQARVEQASRRFVQRVMLTRTDEAARPPEAVAERSPTADAGSAAPDQASTGNQPETK